MATDKQELEQTIENGTARAVSEKEQDFIKLALKRWKQAEEFTADARKKALEHNEFIIAGEQWTKKAKDARTGRICLTFNHAPEAIDRVIGEIRQNPPRGKVRAVDSKTDPKMADVITALGKHIETISKAEKVYTNTIEQPIVNGYPGFMRLETDYVDDDTEEQEIYIRHIPHQFSVMLDPSMTDLDSPSKGGAKWGFIGYDLSRAEFHEQYPKAGMADFKALEGDAQAWWMQERVRVAEYYVARPKTIERVRIAAGRMVDKASQEYADFISINPDFEKSNPSIKKKVHYEIEHYVISGTEILAGPEVWPGKFIPIIPCDGKTFWNNGKKVSRGLYTNAMDAARMRNYFWSQITETVALAPKGKWIGTAKMVENNHVAWKNANQSNDAFLAYDPDPNAPSAMPQFVSPPAIQAGHVQALQLVIDEEKSLRNVYDASLGAKSNETSGRAIGMRDAQMQAAHFPFIDNLKNAVEFVWVQIIDLIPKIYDTHRTFRVYGEDGREKNVIEINKPTGETVRDETGQVVQRLLNDVTVGRYDVVVDTGPSLKTQRQETMQTMTQLATTVPAIGQVGGDLIARAADFQYADELADRIHAALLKQGFVAEKEDDETGAKIKAAVEQVQQQAMQAFQSAEAKINELNAQVQQASQAMNDKAAELELKKYEIDVRAKTELEKVMLQKDTVTVESLQKQIAALAAAVESKILSSGAAQ